MDLFYDDTEEMSGYSDHASPPAYLPAKRVIRAKAYTDGQTWYFRLHDICSLLGIKQPFDFSKGIRTKVPDAFLSGNDTRSFREEIDTDRTVFISASGLFSYLSETKESQTYLPGMCRSVLTALKCYT